MTGLEAGTVADAASVALDHEPVPASLIVDGSPTTGFVELTELDGAEVGVWEMTPGAMRDTEADELFVVVAGSATVAFDDPALESIDLRPGSVVRLRAGMRTVWTVRETLRKVYIAP
ncbi:cupin domain-containing protein [Microbacterium awajiense]|uniref:Cupin domain-containing protein n=1 Tax=Microbacterium awajiense TaxID=415214 RepID=A0ABP7AK14_9MICO